MAVCGAGERCTARSTADVTRGRTTDANRTRKAGATGRADATRLADAVADAVVATAERRARGGGGHRGPSVAPPLCRASLPSGVRYVRPTPPLAIRFSIPNEATNGFATTFIIYFFFFLLPKFFSQHESSDSNEKIWFL